MKSTKTTKTITKPKTRKPVRSTRTKKSVAKTTSARHAGHSQLNIVLTVVAGVMLIGLLVTVGYKWQETRNLTGPKNPVSPGQLSEEAQQQ